MQAYEHILPPFSLPYTGKQTSHSSTDSPSYPVVKSWSEKDLISHPQIFHQRKESKLYE